jgi:hypothetical protein
LWNIDEGENCFQTLCLGIVKTGNSKCTQCPMA